MELRKVCNHPLLTYPEQYDPERPELIVRQCGKMLILDRVLVKMFRTGHRVLLFSTMTKLLDLLEDYLRWRVVEGGQVGAAGCVRAGGRGRPAVCLLLRW
jgi:hypothetical protein